VVTKRKAPAVKALALPSRGRGTSTLETRLAKPVSRDRLRALTAREQKFVYEFVSSDGTISMTEAAIRAGYSETSARQTAHDLTNPNKYPHVVAAIQDYRKELAERYGTTFERHMRDLQRIRDAALQAGAFGAAVSAEYRRGQALGTIYVDRKEILVGTIDSMSRDEVAAKLAEIKKLFVGASQDIVDVDPVVLDQSVEREMAAEPEFDEEEVLNERIDDLPAAAGESAGLSHDEAGEPSIAGNP
jgi:phage terminase small subunit